MNYSLDDLVRETGLPKETLRLWIRGYRVLGQRRDTYTPTHLDKLRLVDRALRAGHPLDLVARLPRRDLRKLLQGRDAGDYLADALEAVQAIDAQALALSLRQAALRLPTGILLDEVMAPLLEAVGRFWEQGSLTVATEHLVSVVVRSELSRLYESSHFEADAPTMLVTTPAGHRHELGALMAAVMANQAGWRAVFLGCDLPTREILQMASYLNVKAVALSAVYPAEDRAALAQIADLRERLPGTVELIVGGQAAQDYKPRLQAMGAVTLGSLTEFEDYLRSN